MILLCAIIAGITLPMLPTQLLWLNLITALFLGLTLVFEPKESDIMQRPPRDPKKPLLTFPLFMRTGLVTLISLAGAFGLFAWEHRIEGTNLDEARAAVVNVIVMVQTFYLLNCRSRTRPAFSIDLFSNRWLIAGILATWLAQFAFTYLPLVNELFHTAPMRAAAWLYIIAIGVFTFTVVEMEKWIRFGHHCDKHALPDEVCQQRVSVSWLTNDFQADMMLRAPQRDRTNSSPVWRQVIVFVLGGVTLTVGLVMLVMPGPAIVFIPLGLAILATEFRWARKWLSAFRQWFRRRFKNQTKTRNEPNHEGGRNEVRPYR